jgi:alanyl-tRNA synthetase
MTAKELREKYLNFFKERGHAIIPSASLIPENDPTVLFTTAGMHPLTPYLLGEKHPAGKRIADVQKCIRTSDINDVGDAWHLTFFEMLGNWSLGDYWKKEAIEWSFEFLTDEKYLAIAPEKLSVTVFKGDADAPADEDSVKIWQNLGIPKERIFYLPKEDNWWGPAGQAGPCGPCTEMFFDTGKKKCSPDCHPGCKCGKYAEIWNDVFMEFNKTAEGKFEPLKQKNVDTGMGVERTIAVLNGFSNVFDTELFVSIIGKIEELSGKKYGIKITSPRPSPSKGEGEIHPSPPLQKEGEDVTRAMRIVADHVKAATFILAEGLEPSNVERGYVLRRLIRRSVRYGKQLGINSIFTFKVAEEVIKIYQDTYAELKKNKEFIINQLVKEEEKFEKTLEQGMKEFQNIIETRIGGAIMDKRLASHSVFTLYTSYGFPIELIVEMAEERGLYVDMQVFEQDMEEHQELSRTASAGMFKGGLADTSEQTVKYHTAAHLMLAALRKVLGEHVTQKGSNITAERLRFDFSHPQKMTEEEIKKVEDLVNEKIQAGLPVKIEEMSLEEAKTQGATGVFESKYGERVKVYTIGEGKNIFSREICGGPHVERTGLLGKFKIVKEESSSAGVRRIKAVLE